MSGDEDRQERDAAFLREVLLDWAAEEPSPVRDVGPYQTEGQARAQFEATAFGLPAAPTMLNVMNLKEALLLAGVIPGLGEFEEDTLLVLAQHLTGARVQVIAGWVLRAALAGQGGGKPEEGRPVRGESGKRPQRVVTVEDGVEVSRVYPTFGRGWDAAVAAGEAGHRVISRAPISEEEFRAAKDR